MTREDSDWSMAEDRRPAEPPIRPSVSERGDRCWLLGIALYAGAGWPIDSYTRLWITHDAMTDQIVTIHGKYWPQSAQGDGDDGA